MEERGLHRPETARDTGQHRQDERQVDRNGAGAGAQVIGTATHSETGDTLVVYRPLYGDQALWVRPLAMFTETVERDGKVQPRFARVGD